VVVSSAANGNILPFQVIFQGLTPRSLPPKNDERVACEDNGWHLTFSSNHWSTLNTCKDFVNNILLNYRMSQIDRLGLSADQYMIWLIDYWSVYISKEFRAWMKSNYPIIHLLFIPANCTSIFQPADVILQRPFKHAFRVEFNKFTMDVISNQIDKDEDLKVDLKMSTLRPKICGWLFTAWHNLTTRREMVKKGWSYTGLQRAFEPEFQKQAMIDNIKTPLFNIEENVAVETNNNNDNEETCIEVSLDTILEDSLTRVSLLTTSNNTISIATLRGMARKMSPYATSSITSSDSRVEVATRRSNPAVQLLPIQR
jgi:hypothetical protein